MQTLTNKIHLLNPLYAIGFALLFLCSQISVSHATPATLAPSGSVAASSGSFSAGGSDLLFTSSDNFSSGSLSGLLVSSVYNNDANNQYGLADLTFTFEIFLDNNSPDAASAISIGNFAGFNTDVSYVSNGGGVPTTVGRDPNGSQIVFNFGGYILPGDNSALLVIQTDGTAVKIGTASVIDDVGTPGIPSFSPTVPDSTGIGCFVFGLGLLVGLARFTKTASVKI